ncbi:MAG: tol-pal system-associated acyl-CoA thioesterase [Rhodocyclales bacterium]|nr:tol-pal system-associated acyl-CoA thioesterase [Rhodocyclales bacterium]
MRRAHPSTSPRITPTFTLPVRVYYEDTDAAGVVYYANYLRFCERARTEWLRSMGYDQRTLLETTGIAFVVRSVQADFKVSARLDDALEVVSSIARLGHASLVFAQNIIRDQELILDSIVTIACIDTRKQRPCAIPSDLRTRFLACIPK